MADVQTPPDPPPLLEMPSAGFIPVGFLDALILAGLASMVAMGMFG